MVWFTYWVNGRFTTSLFKVKLLQADAALRGHEGQAVIVLSTADGWAPRGGAQRAGSSLAGPGPDAGAA